MASAAEAPEREEADDRRDGGQGQSEASMDVSEEEVEFIGGRGGIAQARIARASGCEVDLVKEKDGSGSLRFRGRERELRLAKTCARLILEHRSGAVRLDEAEVASDCTLVRVPEEAMAVVLGRGGSCLRSLQDDNSVVAAFVQLDGADEEAEGEELAIFGGRRGRRAAQLAVMGIVESKAPDFFMQAWRETGSLYELEADLDGDWASSTRELDQAGLSYLIGKGGSTRRKISQASGCLVVYLGMVAILSGTRKQRERAQEYMQWLLQQLKSPERPPVRVDMQGRKDSTVVHIPVDCVGYVTGKGREALGAMEESWGVLTFFVEHAPEEDGAGPCEALAIFGPMRSRCGAELLVKSVVETKTSGYFTHGLRASESRAEGFARDYMVMENGDISYALGKGGSTRRKLAAASNAVFQFIGQFGIVAGTLVERRRCREYVQWLLDQRDGGKVVVDSRGRGDMTEVRLEDSDANWLVRGAGSWECRQIEQDTGTFLFLAENHLGRERLLICGHDAGAPHSKTGRAKAEELVEGAIRGHSRQGGGGRGSWGGGQWSGGQWGGGRSGGGSWGGHAQHGGDGHGSSWGSGSWSGRDGNSWHGGSSSSWSGGYNGSSGHRSSYQGRWEQEREEPRSRSPVPRARSPAPRGRTPAPRGRTPAPRARTPARQRSRERGEASPHARRYGGGGGGREPARGALGWSSRPASPVGRGQREGWEPAKDEPVPPWRQKSAPAYARSAHGGGGGRR